MSTTGQTNPILLTSLLENLLDQYRTDVEKQKIVNLRKQIEDEREKLSKIRHAQQRKKELERLRLRHEKKRQDEGAVTKRALGQTLKKQRS